MFSFDPATGIETVLHNVLLSNDGFPPGGNIVIAGANTLYGTTELGGIDQQGSLYSLDLTTGTEAVLFSFDGESNGGNLYGGLVADGQGSLYGTTELGGKKYYGIAYRFIPATAQFAILHHFSGNLNHGHDGEYPLSPLILDATGRTLYGTTCGTLDQNMQKPDAEGTVFAIDAASGKTKNIALFNMPKGSEGGVTLGRDGALYGTTVGHGKSGDWTIFRVRP